MVNRGGWYIPFKIASGPITETKSVYRNGEIIPIERASIESAEKMNREIYDVLKKAFADLASAIQVIARKIVDTMTPVIRYFLLEEFYRLLKELEQQKKEVEDGNRGIDQASKLS